MENKKRRNTTYTEYEDILDTKSSKTNNTSYTTSNKEKNEDIKKGNNNNTFSNECYVWEVKNDTKQEQLDSSNSQSSLFDEIDVEATSSLKELQQRNHDFNKEEIVQEFNNLEDESIKWTVHNNCDDIKPLFDEQQDLESKDFENITQIIQDKEQNNNFDDNFEEFEIIDETQEFNNDESSENNDGYQSNDYFNVFDENKVNDEQGNENEEDFIIIGDEQETLDEEDYFNIFNDDNCECEECECEKEANDELADVNFDNDDFVIVDNNYDDLENVDDYNNEKQSDDIQSINNINDSEELSDLDIDLNDFMEIEGDDILDLNEQEDIDLSGLVADNDENEKLFNEKLITEAERKLNSTLEESSLLAIKEKIKNLEGTLSDVQKTPVYSQDELIKKLNETYNASEEEINTLLKSASMKISFINDVIERAKTKFNDYDSNFLYNIINKIEDAVETFKRNNNLK